MAQDRGDGEDGEKDSHQKGIWNEDIQACGRPGKGRHQSGVEMGGVLGSGAQREKGVRGGGVPLKGGSEPWRGWIGSKSRRSERGPAP